MSGPESVAEAQETKRALAVRQLKRGKNKVLFLMGGKLIVLNKPKVLIGGQKMERLSLSLNVGGNEDKREEKDI